MIHSYCDILVELHERDKAEKLIKNVINKTINSTAICDERFVLQAIMYNRWYVSYNNAEQTQEVISKRTNYMKLSRDGIVNIKDQNKKNLIKYLNDSDEGYNYYGYLCDRKKLLNIWDECVKDIPHIIPEKTMNYYRKLVQYDLINKDYNKTLKHIAQGRYYLENGEYAHEPLIFNTFFIMAEIMANLQHFQQKRSYYIEKQINDVIQIQRLLNNGKMGDILLLKGVYAYYSQDEKGLFYSFKDAYEEYSKKSTSRFWIKKELLLENIQRSFTEYNIYNNYDLSFLPIKYRTPLTEHKLLIKSASGIQQTKDGKMNLPLI